MDNRSTDIAVAFVRARKAGVALADYPGDPPENLDSAYAIQDTALSIWQREIGGWKVGRIPAPVCDEVQVDRLAGPVFTDTIQSEKADGNKFGIFAEGFAAVEAEFMMRLVVAEDSSLPQTPQEAMNWVDEVRIGLEIASSPYPGINDDGPFVTISDHGNNFGLLLGAIVPQSMWSQLDDVDVTLSIDGQAVGKANTSTMLDGPFGAVAFLLGNLKQRGIQPKSGWWISTGAITGVHEISTGQHATSQFEGVGTVSAKIDATSL